MPQSNKFTSAAVREKKEKYKVPDNLMMCLEDLKVTVENINKVPDIALRGTTFQALDKDQIMTAHLDGFTFGYKIDDFNTYLRRKVFVTLDQPINTTTFKKIWNVLKRFATGKDSSWEWSLPDVEPVMLAVFETFLERGQGIPTIEVSRDQRCVMLTQDFVPLYLVERNPRVLVPGGTVH